MRISYFFGPMYLACAWTVADSFLLIPLMVFCADQLRTVLLDGVPIHAFIEPWSAAKSA